MKRLIITTLLILSSLLIRANDKLILITVEDQSHLYSLFENQSLEIHYYTDSYIIGSINEEAKIEDKFIVLDEKAFVDIQSYYIVYCPETQRKSYLTEVENTGKILYGDGEFLIMKPIGEKNNLQPAKNDGMVYIPKQKALLPSKSFNFPEVTKIDPFIRYLTDQVSTENIMATIQHLQNYGTRYHNLPKAFEAQNWLKAKYEAMGLEVEIHTFSNGTGGAASSGNVIAIQRGTTYPNEYIVCGSHYDSINPSNNNNCPGADDNASGTAGILEIARILSQYKLERSIIYCNFSAEEIGLIGSNAYATRCNQQEMNILGYFNIDMSGYLEPGTLMRIDLVYPNSAAPLANYYTNVANVYFPLTPITSHASIPGADSDHTSFNQKGYMGIFPFEDINLRSPYIHTSSDVIGKSVNTPNQCRLFTQITFASISTLANINIDEFLPVPFFYASETEIFEGNTVQFTDMSTNEPTECYWFFEGGTPEESTVQHPKIWYQTPGVYDVKLIVSNNYGIAELIKSGYITVNSEVGIVATNNYPSFQIYPNPTKNKLTISPAGGGRGWTSAGEGMGMEELTIENIEIFDVFGRKMLEQKVESRKQKEIEIDISYLSEGIYFLQITTDNNIITKKIVKY